MNVITYYIGKEILKGSILTLMILLTLFNLFTFADELKDLKDGYDLKHVFYYVGLTSPKVLYALVPSSALIGSLFVLGSMGNNRELVAMQAAGLSVGGIIFSVLQAGLVLVVFSLMIGEFIAPVGEKWAQKIKSTALNENVIMNSKYGVWLREADSYINVRQVEDDGLLGDVNIFELDDQRRLSRTLHADKAIFLGNNEWKLVKTRESSIMPEKVETSEHDEQRWHSSIKPNLLKIVVVDPDNLSLYDLAQYVGFLKENHQKSQSYEMAFWGRAINPLATLIMMLASAPFVIGIHRGISVGARILMGVTIGMGFNLINKMSSHFGLIYDLNPPLIAILPSLTALALILYAMKKART